MVFRAASRARSLIPNTEARQSVLQKWLRADLDSRHGNLVFAELDSRSHLHGHEGNRSSIFCARPIALRSALPQDEIQAIPHRSVRHRLSLRPVRREFDLQRAAGARGASLHARISAPGIYTYGKSLDDASSIGGGRRAPSCSRTATCTPSTAFRPSTCATNSAPSRCTNCRSASEPLGQSWLEGKCLRQLATSEYFHLADRHAVHRFARRRRVRQRHRREFLAARRIRSATRIWESAAARPRVFQYRRLRAAHGFERKSTYGDEHARARSKARASSAGIGSCRNPSGSAPSSGT